MLYLMIKANHLDIHGLQNFHLHQASAIQTICNFDKNQGNCQTPAFLQNLVPLPIIKRYQ